MLPKRPRGVRRHWKAEQVRDLASLGSTMRANYVSESFGDPVEGRRYSCRGSLKRLDARYENGRVVSISMLSRGKRIAWGWADG